METQVKKNGKGRGHLDTLETDVEAALMRTPLREPGPAAKERQLHASELKIPLVDKREVTYMLRNEEDSSLVTHRFPHGPLAEMLKGKDETKTKKRVLPARIPDEEFRLALYVMDRSAQRLIAGPNELERLRSIDLNDKEKYAFVLPMGMFKGALVSAAKFVKGLSPTYIKQTLHVFGDFGDFGEILTDNPPIMREDIVRIGVYPNKTPSPRYRPEFKDWSIKLRVRYNAEFISDSQIASLLQYAGLYAGVGEMRPEKCGGTRGMFTPW